MTLSEDDHDNYFAARMGWRWEWWKCPSTSELLLEKLQQAWSHPGICKEWKSVEGISIPREENAESINQFRNVDGKTFVQTLDKRLTSCIVTNEYVDKDIQKGQVFGVPGCLDHSTLTREAIQRTKAERTFMSSGLTWVLL